MLASVVDEESSEPFYGLRDYRDLFWKCKHDLKQFWMTHDDELSSYGLFNLVVTIDHLFDWVLNDPALPENKKARCIERFNPYGPGERIPNGFEKYYPACPPSTNEDHRLVRKVANKAKHRRLEPETPMLRGTALVGSDLERLSEVEYTGYFAGGAEEHGDLPALCEDLLRDWQKFLGEIDFLVMTGNTPR